MTDPRFDDTRDSHGWQRDAFTVKVGWMWWLILISNMIAFAWGVRTTSPYVTLASVWLGAFSCCMIYHIESLKRILALRSEVEELRRTVKELRERAHEETPSSR
jgi:hypothetical protein